MKAWLVMMLLVLVWLIVLLAGCQQTPQLPPAPAVRVSQVSISHESAIAPATNATRSFDLPPFIYPANPERYTWSIMATTDLVTWTAIASGMTGTPSGAYHIAPTNQFKFYRMKGM